MPKLNPNSIPAYRLHRQSGQAIVSLNGRDFLLGKHNSAASKAEYTRLTAEWIAAGRRTPTPAADLTVAELIDRYRQHVEGYYRKPDGTPTSEVDNIRQAMRPLRKLYGSTPASAFGPLKLKAVRQEMIQPADGKPGWTRKNINKQANRIRGLFKWSVENELLPPSVYHGLIAVAGLKQGRTEARESEPVQPVSDELVNATLAKLPTTVASMVRIQRLTGARPGEICAMRIGDIDRTGDVWAYCPASHKTQHHGKRRTIFLGSKAQTLLAPFLLKIEPTAYVFSPGNALAEMRQERAAARKTPMSCGNKPGSNRTSKPKRKPGDRYVTTAYNRAIARACELAFPAPAEIKDDPAKLTEWHKAHHWHAHQLRHTAATDVRRQFGLEAAQHMLGHASVDMTQIYAEKNAEIARAVARKIG